MECTPAIEMLQEQKVLRFLIKTRLKQAVNNNIAMAMLSDDLKRKFLLENDISFKEINNALQQLEGLIEEELDYLIPTNIMLEELTNK